MPSYLVTGSSRGLGLAFVTELLKDPNNTVVATARNTAGSKGLQQLKAKDTNGKLILVDLDVTNVDSIRAAAEVTTRLLPQGLDYLLSNAGIDESPDKSFDNVDLDKLVEEVAFTLTTPIKLLREFLPLVRKSTEKKIMVISSVVGSIELAPTLPGLSEVYSVSRAALNMLVRKWSPTLKNDGVTIVLIHPGWVGATDLGVHIKEYITKYAPHVENVPPQKSAAGVVKVLNGITEEDNGAFFNLDGTKLPW